MIVAATITEMLVYLEEFVFRGKKYDLEVTYRPRLHSRVGGELVCAVEQGWCGTKEITPDERKLIELERFDSLVAACKVEILAYPDDYPLPC